MTKQRKKSLTIAVITIVVFSMVLLLCFFFCPAQQSIRSLKNGNYDKLDVSLRKTEAGLQKALFSFLLPEALSDINEEFNCGERTAVDTKKLYDFLIIEASHIEISDYLSEFTLLVSSKNAFNKAESAMEQSDYLTAIDNYEEVIAKDMLYNSAQQKIQEAKKNFISSVTDEFYLLIRNRDTEAAKELLDNALEIFPNESLKSKRTKISANFYNKIYTMLDNAGDWETISQSHAGDNIYTCYQIKRSKTDSHCFECYYVLKSMLPLIKEGGAYSISGPVAWYRITNDSLQELSYDEERYLENGGYSSTIEWDYRLSQSEKMSKLERLLDQNI